MTSTMSTWRSNQLSYDPMANRPNKIIAYSWKKCKGQFEEIAEILRDYCRSAGV